MRADRQIKIRQFLFSRNNVTYRNAKTAKLKSVNFDFRRFSHNPPNIIPANISGYMVFLSTGERSQGTYALLMTANKPETAVYRAPTFSLLLASHGGISSCRKIHYNVLKTSNHIRYRLYISHLTALLVGPRTQ